MSLQHPTPASGSPEQGPQGPFVVMTPEQLAAAVRDGLALHTQDQQEAYRRALQERVEGAQRPSDIPSEPVRDRDYVDPEEQAAANAAFTRRNELEGAFDPKIQRLGRLGLKGTAAKKAYGSAAEAHATSNELGRKYQDGQNVKKHKAKEGQQTVGKRLGRLSRLAINRVQVAQAEREQRKAAKRRT